MDVDKKADFKHLVVTAKKMLDLSKKLSHDEYAEKIFVAKNLYNVIMKMLEYKIVKNIKVSTLRRKAKNITNDNVNVILNELRKLVNQLELSED